MKVMSVYDFEEDSLWFIDIEKITTKKFLKLSDEKKVYYTIYNDDYPSVILHTKQHEWYLEGRLHRITGPAMKLPITTTKRRRGDYYFLWGVEYTKEEYIEAMDYLKENGDISFKLRYYKEV